MVAPPARKSFTIAIIGGGITGVTLAIALTRRGVPCKIYEQASAFSEIGAGIGLQANAVRAMNICDPAITTAFKEIASRNLWPSKRRVFFDLFDGTSTTPAEELLPEFSIFCREGLETPAACHRARFLDGLVRLLPDGIAEMKKRLLFIDECNTGRLVLRFADGTSEEADAVVGCDGVKSKTRELMVGSDNPAAKCGYSHKFAYRGLIPMEQAVEVLGKEKAENASIWMGPDRHVLTFPVNHGATLNLVAFVTSTEGWPSEMHLVLPSTRQAALADFEGFGPTIISLLKLVPRFDRWGLFDLADNPLTTFCDGRICVLGDAAHASTPHHGAGAGMGIEDVAVLASLLADVNVRRHSDIEAALKVYDEARRGRDQWLVQKSRSAAEIYEWRELGRDFGEMERILTERQHEIWTHDVDGAVEEALRLQGLRYH